MLDCHRLRVASIHGWFGLDPSSMRSMFAPCVPALWWGGNVSGSESESVGMAGTSGRSRGLREPSVSYASACHIRCREDMTARRTRGWSAIGVDGLHGGTEKKLLTLQHARTNGTVPGRVYSVSLLMSQQ